MIKSSPPVRALPAIQDVAEAFLPRKQCLFANRSLSEPGWPRTTRPPAPSVIKTCTQGGIFFLRKTLNRACYLCFCLILQAGITGCLTTPEPDQLTAPESWKHSATAVEDPMPGPGDWWLAFRDPGLTALMVQFDAKNPSLAAALARHDQARAALGLTRSETSPVITGDSTGQRRRDSQSGTFVPDPPDYNQFEIGLNLDYEIDLWGRVRNRVHAARDDLYASGADVAAAALSLKTDLARQWFQLRFFDEEIDLVRQAVALREESLTLISAQVKGGEASDLDLARARTEIESARAQKHDLQRSRSDALNALAALCGQAPAEFQLPGTAPSTNSATAWPPVGLPSEMLERRPDVFAARKRLAAACFRIGVVRSRYLPAFSLGLRGGLSSLKLSDLFDADSFFGRIGPDVAIPIYSGGGNKSDIARAEAESREALAIYREAVVTALRETEDALSGLHWLDLQIKSLDKAATSASRSAQLSRKRYEAGLVSYLEVVDAERTALTVQRDRTRARAARQLAGVQLVKALGGGWRNPDPLAETSEE